MSDWRSQSTAIIGLLLQPPAPYLLTLLTCLITTSSSMVDTKLVVHILEIIGVFVCAHHFWPKGITYGEEDDWETARRQRQSSQSKSKSKSKSSNNGLRSSAGASASGSRSEGRRKTGHRRDDTAGYKNYDEGTRGDRYWYKEYEDGGSGRSDPTHREKDSNYKDGGAWRSSTDFDDARRYSRRSSAR